MTIVVKIGGAALEDAVILRKCARAIAELAQDGVVVRIRAHARSGTGEAGTCAPLSRPSSLPLMACLATVRRRASTSPGS